jgi:hypothetical protein
MFTRALRAAASQLYMVARVLSMDRRHITRRCHSLLGEGISIRRIHIWALLPRTSAGRRSDDRGPARQKAMG